MARMTSNVSRCRLPPRPQRAGRAGLAVRGCVIENPQMTMPAPLPFVSLCCGLDHGMAAVSSTSVVRYPGQFIAHGPGTPQVLQRPSEGASDAPALEPFIVWAAKVEWTFLTVALPHSVQLGSSTRRFNTSHSNRVSQSEQWYSKIGIAP